MKTFQIIYILVCITWIFRAFYVPDYKKPFWRYWWQKHQYNKRMIKELMEKS